MYAGQADWDAIAQVKQTLDIPVVANGDVSSPEDAREILAHTGADGVMIGRGALGNPWLFAQCQAMDDGTEIPASPELADRLRTARVQIELAREYKGERIAMLEARKHLAWYVKGIRGTKKLKAKISALTSLEQLDELLDEVVQTAGGNHV